MNFGRRPSLTFDPTERTPTMPALDTRTRWLALYTLCLATLMIVLDTTIVNVALPSIRDDLGFSQTSLAWVVNAYVLTYAGLLLLGGRLGDLFGQRRPFIAGGAAFSASGACSSQESRSSRLPRSCAVSRRRRRCSLRRARSRASGAQSRRP